MTGKVVNMRVRYPGTARAFPGHAWINLNGRTPMSKWIFILWPSFVTAALGEIVFFALIDPQELYLMGKPVDWSPMAVYSVGFLMFWALTALTAALCFFFQKPAAEINRPPKAQPGQARRHLRSV
jgi:hypothetical protein